MRAFLRNGLLWALVSTSLSCFLLVFSSSGQITFERTYGGEFADWGSCVQQTLDGGYIVAGVTLSFGVSSEGIYLVKTDSLGKVLWERTYGWYWNDDAYWVQQTADGGYIVAGCTDCGQSSADIYLIRMDSLGDSIWARRYDSGREDCARFVGQTSDGGYIAIGYTHLASGGGDVYLIRTDTLGNVVWENTYDMGDVEYAFSGERALDGGYIAAGAFEGEQDVLLLKTDSLGSVMWDTTFGGSGLDWGNSVNQTTDGGYIVAGCRDCATDSAHIYLIKTDSVGNGMFEMSYGGAGSSARSVEQTLDEGYIVAGCLNCALSPDTSDLYLVRTDPLGDVAWERTYGGSSFDRGSSVQQTSDGGCIIAGTTCSFGAGRCDVYLIKTDSDGLVARDVTVMSLDAPDDTVFTDSTYEVRASVENLLPGFPSFDVVATIEGYVDTVRVAGLPPESLLQVTFENWQVPSADSVTYTMTVWTHAEGDIDTTNDYSQKSIFAYNPVGIGESEESGIRYLRFELGQNEPNPFQGWTGVWYCISTKAKVTLAVYDITGRLVETLVDETQQPGIHQVRWNRESNPSGVYFYRLRAGESAETRKMVVVE